MSVRGERLALGALDGRDFIGLFCSIEPGDANGDDVGLGGLIPSALCCHTCVLFVCDTLVGFFRLLTCGWE
jgi:hypothetical protein